MSLDDSVLVLNKAYQPISITTVRRAFCLMAKGHCQAVDENYRLYSFEEWVARPRDDSEAISTPHRMLSAPRIILASFFSHLPRRQVKFSRRNVYLRDNFTCQYCGRKGRVDDLNLDHVLPVSRGGKSCWTNVVTACRRDNSFKGDRTPEAAGLKLIRKPEAPSWRSFMLGVPSHKEWEPFLPTLARS